MTSKEKYEFLEKNIDKLMECFDAVQVLATWYDDKGLTHRVSLGAGNWYTRIGLAHQFIKNDQNEDMAAAIGMVIEPPPDTDESWKNEDGK